ncbi:MAG: ABC transporter ATP-binding protein [Henriciella sp.]|nr:ABC transporter ATP-binding protein [Henriciella sp.]
MTDPVVSLSKVEFAWTPGATILDVPSFSVEKAERIFLRGPSGSGKSTLLGLIAGVLTPQSGTVTVMGQDMATLPGHQRDRLRANHLGVIFQMFNLVPYLSVRENVALPCRFSKRRKDKVRQAGGIDREAERLLGRLGLSDDDILDRSVRQLSVGQQQRVAAARALIGEPALIMADEPTSALDADHRDQFIDLLSEEARRSEAALLFVSHDASLAGLFDRAVDLQDLNAVKSGVAA